MVCGWPAGPCGQGLLLGKLTVSEMDRKERGWGEGGEAFRRTELCRRNERTMDSSCCMVIYSMFSCFFVYCAMLLLVLVFNVFNWCYVFSGGAAITESHRLLARQPTRSFVRLTW